MKDKILNKWIFSYLSLVTCWDNGEVIFPAKDIRYELNWELSLHKSHWTPIKRVLLLIPSAYKAITDLRGFFVCQEM